MNFRHEETLDRYLSLRRDEPRLFGDPTGEIEILTDLPTIEAARNAARQDRKRAGQDTSDLRVGILARDPYMTIVRDAVRFPDGTLGLHNRIVEERCVAVLPLLDGKPVLISIFRHGLRRRSLEFPRGALHRGETAEYAVGRELKEEIGANVLSLQSLGPHSPGGSSLSVESELFLARIDGTGRPQRAEAITEIRPVDVNELERLILSGAIIDGFSMSLFARARLSGSL